MVEQQNKLFLALDFSLSFKKRMMEALGSTVLHYIDFIPAENLHLTLRWFGATTAEQEAKLIQILQQLSSFPASKIQVEGIHLFEKKRKPSVMWFAIAEGKEELHALFNHIVLLLHPKRETFTPERFSPHITVARLSTRKNSNKEVKRILKEYNHLLIGEAPVEELTLFRSVSIEGIRRYIPLHRFKLAPKKRMLHE